MANSARRTPPLRAVLVEFPNTEVLAVPRPTLARLAGALRPTRRKADVPDTDHALLTRFVQSRDDAAFRALVHRHANTVLAACRQVLHDPADIDDAFQAAYLVLLKKAKALDATTPLGGWLYAVAHRVSVRRRADNARRTARETEAAKRAKATGDPPDVSWKEAAAVLHAELNTLPDRYRLPLLLCYLQGLTRDEAAEQLGTSVGAVRGQLERGRKLLERRLHKRGLVLSAGLLAVLLGGSTAAGGPPAGLIDLAVSAAHGNSSSAVTALAHGAFPMTTVLKRTLLTAVLALGLFGAAAGLGGGSPQAAADEKKPADKMEKPKADAKPDAKPQKPTRVGGTVKGPDGKPLAGAEVFIGYYRTGGTWAAGEDRSASAKLATADADGTFAADVPSDAPAYFWVYATKPGFGVAWTEPKYPSRTFTEPMKLALKLVADQPITGAVVGSEGKAAAGATVTVFTLMDPTDRDFDKFLKAAANDGFGRVGQWDHPLHPPAAMFRATTDADGKFELKGVGGDRIVGLAVAGQGIARQSGLVLTRKGVDVAPLNEHPKVPGRTRVGREPVFYPPEVKLVVVAGYAVEGVVTNKTTGKPIPGCSLEVNTGHWDRLNTKTDKDGKYRFDGLTKGMSHHVNVFPPKGADVFPTWGDVKEPSGYQTVTHDIALAPGAVFAGKVIDKQTKEPVPASFQILPAADNPFAKKPEYETASRDATWKGGGGTFRIITLPGKSKVNISISPTGTLHGEPFHPYLGGQTLDIDLPEVGVKEYVVEIDRGKTATVTAADSDGKPLTGLVVGGMTQTNHDGVEQLRVFKLPAADAKFTVYGLGEKEKRRVVVIQPEKRLAASLLATADADAKLTLVPLQPLRGTFTDADGTPLAGASVTIDYNLYGTSGLFREHATAWKMSAVTDKDGKFEIPDVIPGVPFTFDVHKGDVYYRGTPRLGTQTVPADKPLELGTRKLEEFR